MYPKFQIFKSSANNQYYFRLRSKQNGEIILGSEAYATKQSCQNGIESVRINSQFNSRYQKQDRLINYTFNLVASNGEIIGRSENYTTAFNRDNGISAVKRDAPSAPIEDLS